MSESDLTSASLTPQSPEISSFEAAPRQPCASSIVDEARGHGLARHHLHLRIERGPDRQTAFVELLFAVALEHVAADLFGEILAGEDVRGIAPAGHGQRILAGLVGIGLFDPAVLQQPVDHVVAPLDGAVAVAHRMQRRGRLGQRGQIGRLRHGEFVHGFVEIDQRRRGDAVSAKTEIDFIEIEFEDLVLRVGALDPHRQQGFLDLAGERNLVGQEEVLGDLLGDGGGALRPAVGTVVLREQHRGTRHAGEVDAAMLVEILVFGGEKRVDDQLWNRLDRQIEPAFLGILAEQRPVRRMDARHDRRLVILKLGIIRQILGIMPDQPRRRGHADQEHDGSRSKQEIPRTAQRSALSKFRFSPSAAMTGDFSANDRERSAVPRSYIIG